LRLDVERNVGGDKNETSKASTANVNRLCCALDYIASVVAVGRPGVSLLWLPISSGFRAALVTCSPAWASRMQVED